MQAFQRDIAAFERLDTQVVGVSPDDVETHRRFAESLKLTFPLVADPGGWIASQYGQGRIAFLVDTEGVVRLVVEGMPDNAKVLRQIEETLRATP
jgi:peroxiredoxin Q/BCP